MHEKINALLEIISTHLVNIRKRSSYGHIAMLPSFFFFLLTRSVQKNIFMIPDSAIFYTSFSKIGFHNEFLPQFSFLDLTHRPGTHYGEKFCEGALIIYTSVFLIEIAFSCVRLEGVFTFLVRNANEFRILQDMLNI